MKVYRVRDWEKLYENNRTKEMNVMRWVPVPNKQDGEGYRTVISREDGLEIMGAWLVILEVASKCSPRGMLVRKTGEPHTAESIAKVSGANAEKLENALAILSAPEIGWLEDVEAEAVAPAGGDDIKRAHGRVANALQRGHGVCTPAGILLKRPDFCQWCGEENVKVGKGFPSVVAHHPVGYGPKHADLTVIFVCRSCHGLFENGQFVTADIMKKFGFDWSRKVFEIQYVARDLPDDSQVPENHLAGAHAGMEGNGREGNRREHNTPLPPPPEVVIPAQELKVVKNPTRAEIVATTTLPPQLDTPAFRDAWSDWQCHRREIKKPLTPMSVKQQLRDLASLGEAKAIAKIRYTIGKGWVGLEEPAPRFPGKPSPPPSPVRSPAELEAARQAEQRRLEIIEADTRARLGMPEPDEDAVAPCPEVAAAVFSMGNVNTNRQHRAQVQNAKTQFLRATP